MPWARPLIAAEVPVPVEVTLPGLRVSVHVPGDGNPLSVNDPVAKEQVGCVIVPTVGASGTTGGALINTLADETDVHPAALVTV